MEGKLKDGLIVVLVVGLTLAVYYVGVGAGANRKAAELKAEAKQDLTVLETKVAALEKTDKDYEAALNGAAQRLQQLAQIHDNWVKQSTQNQNITRGMLGLIEKAITKELGEKKWAKLVEEVKADVAKAEAKKAEVAKKAAEEAAKAAKK